MAKCMNENMMVVYAIGAVDYAAGKSFEKHARIELGDINDDFKDYVLVKDDSGRSNAMYSLYYNGDFGGEKNHCQLIMIREGWEMNHLVALLMDALKMHKQETKNKKT